MGVLNVTPDSFSDGGLYLDEQLAIDQGLAMVAAGADIIDIGGESTRPGAESPGQEEELRRVIPVVRALRRQCDVLVSVDSSDPVVFKAAAEAGADMLNDVRALSRPGALEAAVACGIPVCIAHMQGTPASMQRDPHYDDVVAEVFGFLQQLAHKFVNAGLDAGSLILDPGFGFGKTLKHNVDLLRNLHDLVNSGWPVMAGLSRKSMIGQLLGDPSVAAIDRLGGSLALALQARFEGARIVRVHDVGPTVQAFRVMDGLENCE
ncbi:MAG: dihydropteroate synthase [Gammaproteobacteria bacterium]